MAKKAEAEETALVVPEKAGMLMQIPDYGEDAGDGFQNQTAADASFPFLKLCQPTTPLVVEGKASPGDWLNTITGQIWKREHGLLYVAATTRRYFAKWTKREEGGGGGGFRGHLDPNDPIVVEAIKRSKKFGKFEIDSEDGETLVLRDTFYIYGSISTENDEYDSYGIIPFWSTKIKSYKIWNARMMPFNGKVPLYGHLMRIRSEYQKNDKGVFYVPVLETADPRGARQSMILPSDERYQASKTLKNMMARGEAKIDYSKSDDSDEINGDPGHPFD